MRYELCSATDADRGWLEELRRAANHDLFLDTFGGWDEARHRRHCDRCWQQGGISVVVVAGERVGMLQVLERSDRVEVGEIEVHPSRQNQEIGTTLLRDVLDRAQRNGKRVILSVGLKNTRARRLYERLGFRLVETSETHHHLECRPDDGTDDQADGAAP